VDVPVRTQNELMFFEIKSDQAARSVIRHALGQILEYAYHPRRQHALPLRLIIVGRPSPSPDDSVYIEYFKSQEVRSYIALVICAHPWNPWLQLHFLRSAQFSWPD